MQKIGMIGGLSWVSTAEYYRLMNEITQAELGGVNSAHIVLESVNRELYAEYVYRRNDEDAAFEMIASAAKSVERAGAEFIVITCNDVHRFVPEVEKLISIPFLHIASAAAEKIKEAGISTVALLGVRKTMELGFYTDVLNDHGIRTIIPDDDERTFVDDSIMNEMVAGKFLDTTLEEYIDLTKSLAARGAEGIVLGCTEIPLLIDASHTDVLLFSTTDIHCHTAIKRAIAN
jgi:aspartate racemase